jgi:hypothetical protein
MHKNRLCLRSLKIKLREICKIPCIVRAEKQEVDGWVKQSALA